MRIIGTDETETEAHLRVVRASGQLLELILKHHGQPDAKVSDDQQVKLLERQFVPVDSDQEDSEALEVCILPIASPRITVDLIKRVVCKHYGISHNDMISPRRDRKVAHPRMIAAYLCRDLTATSLPYIARKFHRDHTSILSAVRKIDRMIKTDAAFAVEVNQIAECFHARTA